jgi:hypothetical protein
VLFDFSSKAKARRPMIECVVPIWVEKPPFASAPPAKKGKWGTKAPRKTGVERAPCFASVRGHSRRSAIAVANQVLVSVELGGPRRALARDQTVFQGWLILSFNRC